MVLNATGVWTEVNYGDASKYAAPKNIINWTRIVREEINKLYS